MQYAEPCQLLRAAAALLEGVAAYLLWLQQQQNWLHNGFLRLSVDCAVTAARSVYKANTLRVNALTDWQIDKHIASST